MEFREARIEDLDLIVEMLADDKLGTRREDFRKPLPKAYLDAFEQICKDPRNELIVVLKNDLIVGTLQLTFIPYLTFRGGERCQIEAVRIHKNFRSQGLGKALFDWAIKRAKDRGCHLVQLTTNKERDRAIEFYDELGFKASHDGMKLYLKPW